MSADDLIAQGKGIVESGKHQPTETKPFGKRLSTTAIEWTDATWNPVTGCDKVSPGCDNCYAEKIALGDRKNFPNGFALTLHRDRMDKPLHWRQPRLVFVNSMSDLFHDNVPDEFICRVFTTMAKAHWHTFQVLTKRPGRMRSLLNRPEFARDIPGTWPLPNVWLGVSTENQKWADIRIPVLADTSAAVRFVSAEPLLEPIDLTAHLPTLDWVIVGGESGPNHRPVEPQWARDIRDQCTSGGVAFLFKQWGGRTPKAGGRELDGRIWDEYPHTGAVGGHPVTSGEKSLEELGREVAARRAADTSSVPTAHKLREFDGDGLGLGAVPGSGNGDREPGTDTVPSSGNRLGTGNSGHLRTVPGSQPSIREPGTAPESPLYLDVSALLDGTLPEPPEPQLGQRTDGHRLFYAGQVNWVFGDPESGKTWLCLACVVEALRAGRRALIVDLDHNSGPATVRRLVDLGAPLDALRDPALFRYCEPDDRAELRQVVDDAATWRPAVAVVDSIGELLPMYGSSSNSADDFTTVHACVLKPLAKAGAAVLAVDHLAKSADSRAVGPGGTAAKRRAIGGVSIRVKTKQPFTPGHGGSATLVVNKDRHGGLRKHCPVGDREPIAGTFKLLAFTEGVLEWAIYPPVDGERNDDENAPAEDVAAVAALDPPPTTVEDARRRLKWQKQRTATALRSWREQPDTKGQPQ